jgi:hypothetical protein
MDLITAAGNLYAAMLLLLTSTAWPPAAMGAFWIMVAIWGFVSVLFDDETPRGTPGIEEIQAYFREKDAPKEGKN